MSDERLGSSLRAVRHRRRLRQLDVADAAGVSRALVSLIERGHAAKVSLETLRRVASVLEIRVDVAPRWRGGELDRLLNAAHSGLHEEVATFFEALTGWELRPEVTFNVYGERGVIDIVAWHAATRTLLVIELKTAIVDVQDLIATMDRRRRLARQIVRDFGWDPKVVACWVVVSGSRTNRRRIAAHRHLLDRAFPTRGSRLAVKAWLKSPSDAISTLTLWPEASRGSARQRCLGRQRVQRPQTASTANRSAA